MVLNTVAIFVTMELTGDFEQSNEFENFYFKFSVLSCTQCLSNQRIFGKTLQNKHFYKIYRFRVKLSFNEN